MKLIPALIVAFATALSIPDSTAAADHHPVCPSRWGRTGEPLVSKEETAKAIFLAIEKDFFRGADAAGYPEIAAKDGGDYWSVFRYRPDEVQPDGTLVVTFGGGQLSMRIAKCDGRVSHVFFTR